MNTQRTFQAKSTDFTPQWFHVDAKDQVLGRLSTKIANILRGKGKNTFTPHVDCGDFVVVTNVDKIKLTGNKWSDKLYYRHSHHIGGIKSSSAQHIRQTHPDRLIYHAVRGMLPKNKLSGKLLTKLKLYAGETHPHQAQNLKTIS
ncbi:MAG: 50S ribosomal protein L13 [Deltaproteobacteria bacterium]|nr:50S ribosomal protein L13 [Deltaproteobacteria bacterium]